MQTFAGINGHHHHHHHLYARALAVPFRAGLARIPSVMLPGHKTTTVCVSSLDSLDSARAAPALDIRALGIIVVGYVALLRVAPRPASDPPRLLQILAVSVRRNGIVIPADPVSPALARMNRNRCPCAPHHTCALSFSLSLSASLSPYDTPLRARLQRAARALSSEAAVIGSSCCELVTPRYALLCRITRTRRVSYTRVSL